MSHTVTQDELVAELRQRFGNDPMRWAFQCPSCRDVATSQDFRNALDAHPRQRRDGSPVRASDLLGQECIGRTLGVLQRAQPKGGYQGRGCDWTAYGLFRGPWFVVLPDGEKIPSFPIADAPVGVGR